MCGRFSLTSDPKALARRFELAEAPQLAPRYNVAPGSDVLAVRRDGPRRRASLLRWGLVPAWAKSPEVGFRSINARAETAATLPAFRAAFRERRCIVPASGFYEWAERAGCRHPYWIGPVDGEPLGIAALWEPWRAPDGDVLESCALLTTPANRLVAELHDRMPAILAPADYATWLQPEAGLGDLEALLGPLPDDALRFHPVSPRVNRADVDDAGCMEPVPEPPRQGTLL